MDRVRLPPVLLSGPCDAWRPHSGHSLGDREARPVRCGFPLLDPLLRRPPSVV